MNVFLTVLIFAPVVCVVGYVMLLAWKINDDPGGRYLFYTYAGVFLWLCCYAIEVNLATEQWKIAVAQVEYIGIATSPVFYSLFAAEYTRGFRPSRRQLVGLLLIPAITIALVVSNPVHNLVWSNYAIQFWRGLSLASRQFEAWFYVHLAYSYTAFLVGLVLFVDVILDRNFFFFRQSAAIFLGSLAPICAALIYPLGLSPLPGFDFVLFGLAVNGALFGYAFFGTEFYDIIPAIRAVGWERMADRIDSGIVVTDTKTMVIELNQTVLEMFDTDRETVIGEPVTVLFQDFRAEATTTDAYELVKPDGGVLRVQSSVVRDRHGHRIGYTYTITDVSEEKRREQQLQVLNRTLRHNLRNKLNIISAYSERIEQRDDTSAGIRDDASNITRAAERIDEIGQTARRVEELMENESTESFDLANTLEVAIQDTRQRYPDSTIRCTVPSGIRIKASPAIEDAFKQILRNAFQHNDAKTTEMAVTAETDSETVRLRFIDDGSGIPDHEVQTIENGGESALEHASGLGLWFIKWTADASGGEVEIESGSDGTTIELVFRRDTQ